MRAPLALILLLVIANASADPIYKWVDEHGITHYGDRPLAANAKPIQLPGLQVFGSSKNLPRRISGPAPYGGSGPKIEVTQPGPDATLLQKDGKFTVSVAVSPALASGQNLNYYLDGELQNSAPTPSTAFLYIGADRGDHMISVAVLDNGGREISRSEPVIVHLQPEQKPKAP